MTIMEILPPSFSATSFDSESSIPGLEVPGAVCGTSGLDTPPYSMSSSSLSKPPSSSSLSATSSLGLLFSGEKAGCGQGEPVGSRTTFSSSSLTSPIASTTPSKSNTRMILTLSKMFATTSSGVDAESVDTACPTLFVACCTL